MKFRFSVICTIAWIITVEAAVLPCRAADVAGQIDFVVRPGEIVVEINDRPLVTYVYSDPKIPRPYFKDIHAPGGIQVTRSHPPREGIDPTDHAEYHPGLWLAFGDLSGADSWRNKAQIEHIEFVQAPCTIGNRGLFTVRNHYTDKDKVICDEVCEYIFLIRPSGYLIVWQSTFQSDQGEFWFGDQEEMGLGVRMATPIMVKSKQGGRILDSEGRKNEKEIWGKQARWCDYSGWVEGAFAGITIMPDSGNLRPCWWHVRDYGFMTANPFGQAAFRAGPISKVQVNKGQSFRLSYGILVHAAASENGVDLEAAYQDYVTVLQDRSQRSPTRKEAN